LSGPNKCPFLDEWCFFLEMEGKQVDKEAWQRFLPFARKYKHSLAAYVRSSEPWPALFDSFVEFARENGIAGADGSLPSSSSPSSSVHPAALSPAADDPLGVAAACGSSAKRRKGSAGSAGWSPYHSSRKDGKILPSAAAPSPAYRKLAWQDDFRKRASGSTAGSSVGGGAVYGKGRASGMNRAVRKRSYGQAASDGEDEDGEGDAKGKGYTPLKDLWEGLEWDFNSFSSGAPTSVDVKSDTGFVGLSNQGNAFLRIVALFASLGAL